MCCTASCVVSIGNGVPNGPVEDGWNGPHQKAQEHHGEQAVDGAVKEAALNPCPSTRFIDGGATCFDGFEMLLITGGLHHRSLIRTRRL